MTVHIMLDLETWGTSPGCDIRSIGACVFDPLTGRITSYDPDAPTGHRVTGLEGMFYIACDNPAGRTALPGENTDDIFRKYPLTRDDRTVKWWNDQSNEARAAFADPVDLREALTRFGQWLRQLVGSIYEPDIFSVKWDDDIRLWSHGPQFDVSILDAAYRAVGLPVPWHYRAPRDTRTAFDMAGITDHSAWLADRPGPLGIPHHALDDVICQARGVCDAYARLRISHDVVTHRDAWRNGLVITRDFGCEGSEEPDADRSYWQHEITAFDRTFNALINHPTIEK